MSQSNTNSKKSLNLNNFNNVDSKRSLRTNNSAEQTELDRNIKDIILSEFQNMNEIKEGDNESEINFSYSNLKGIDEEIIRKSEKSEANQPDLDLGGLDFYEILKSQAKQNSPNIRNFLSNQMKIENKNSDSNVNEIEKLQVNFSQNNFELEEEDIRHLYESALTQRMNTERSPVEIDNLERNLKDFEIDHGESVLIHNKLKTTCNVPISNDNTFSINKCSSLHIGNENPVLENMQIDFVNMMQSQIKFHENAFKKMCDEIEMLKYQNHKLISAVEYLLNRNKCSGRNSPNFIQSNDIHFNNNAIKIEVGSDLSLFTNNQIKIFVNSEDQKSQKVIGSINNNNNNNNFFSQVEDLDFINQQLKTKIIYEKQNIHQKNCGNVNSQSNFANVNTGSAIKNIYETNRSSVFPYAEMREKNGDTERNLSEPRGESYLSSREEKNNTNKEQFLSGFGCNTNNKAQINIIFKKELMNIKDNEFDEIIKNPKNRDSGFRGNSNFDNPFVRANNIDIAPESGMDCNIKNSNDVYKNSEFMFDAQEHDSTFQPKLDLKNLEDDEFDQFLLQAKKKKGMSGEKTSAIQSVTGNKTTRINSNSNIINNQICEQEKINPRDIRDDEFDSFMQNIKNKKLNPSSFSSNFKHDFTKGNLLNSEVIGNTAYMYNRNLTNLTPASTFATLTSDFICNNNPLIYKTNQRTQKLIREMEMETGEELYGITEEENPENFENGNLEKFNYDNKEENFRKLLPNNKRTNNNIEKFNNPKIGVKRNFNEHLKTLNNANSNDACSIEIQGKTAKPGQNFKIERKDSLSNINNNNNFNLNKNNNTKNSKMIDQDSQQIVSTNITNQHDESISKEQVKLITKIKDKVKMILDNHNSVLLPINLSNSVNCEFLCVCLENIIKNSSDLAGTEIFTNLVIHQCKICEGRKIINYSNFSICFINYYNLQCTGASSKEILFTNKDKIKQIEAFLNYQFRLATLKFFLISKIGNNRNKFFLSQIFDHIMKKYNLIFEEGRRSFLTKVSEKDSSINKYMTLQILDIKKSKDGKNLTLELTDGYKSVFSEISTTNPISSLINKNLIYIGMKINIGLAKIEKITDDFDVFIQIFYNSISKADMSQKLGAAKDKKFLIKNLANLREDGGEVSLIDVVVLKKYDYYVFDFIKKVKYSAAKFEKIIDQTNDEMEKRKQSCSFHDDGNFSEREGGYNNYDHDNGQDNDIRSKIKKGETKKLIKSENLNNIKSLKNVRTNKDKDLKDGKDACNGKKSHENFDNQMKKSPFEGISYNFKIVCVDSLLYLNLINEYSKKLNNNNNTNSNSIHNMSNRHPNDGGSLSLPLELKKSLKQKLQRKCVIEIQSKNIATFHNLEPQNRYQLGLLNFFKTTQNSHHAASYDNKILKLKANDSVIIQESKLHYKKTDTIHQNIIKELSMFVNQPILDTEISEFLSQNNYDSHKLNSNDDVSFIGVYLNRYIKDTKKMNTHLNRESEKCKDSNSLSNKDYLFFMNKDNNLSIIKIHDENFFDFSKFTELSKKNNFFQIFHFKNLKFQIVYYYDQVVSKSLTTFKQDKLSDKNFSSKHVVLYMETTPYTSYKNPNASKENIYSELKSKISESQKRKTNIYDEDLLEEVIKCIS